MTAAVLSIGTELTRGELTNSNAAWLGQQLTTLGFEVVEHVTVDDDVDRIVAQVQRLARETDIKVVVATGGLGPTSDDLTTRAVAQALGVELERDPASLRRIEHYFAARHRTMSPSNAKQADFPKGADVLDNDLGTAPGFGVQLDGCLLFFMPGVPKEMEHLFQDRIVPRIAHLAGRTSYQIHLRTFGLPESKLADLLESVEEQFDGVTLGYRASFPEIEVKILARAQDEPAATEVAKRAADEVRARLGEAVFGEGSLSFPASVGRTLANAGMTLAVAESCTGGLVGTMLTSVPGSSEYLLMDTVVYSNAAKQSVLGVSEDTLRAHGAVSQECAVEMVRGALRIAGSDLAVAITGIAGPGGGTDDKPVGTVWLAVGSRAGVEVARFHSLPGDRERIRTLAAYLALRMVRDLATGKEP